MNQEIILKILVAIISSLIMIFLTYIFKRRQLYVVTENLYRTSEISNKGTLCEISIFNRGRLIEEDIRVSLDTSLKYELVAFNDSNMSLEKNIIKINRLHEKSKVSVLLLVENGDFTYKQIIQVDSKTEKGKVIKELDGVPPNVFDLLIVFITIIPIFGMAYYIGYQQKQINTFESKLDDISIKQENLDKIKDYQENNIYYVADEYKGLQKIGWINLVMYKNSLISRSYFGTEFPIRFKEKKKVGEEEFIYTFEIYNKTTQSLDVMVDIANKSFFQEQQHKNKYFNYVEDVEPLSKTRLETKPINPIQFSELEFVIKMKGTSYDEKDFIYGLIYKIE